MNSPKTTLLLLILIVVAAMWTSGRLTKLLQAFAGKDSK